MSKAKECSGDGGRGTMIVAILGVLFLIGTVLWFGSPAKAAPADRPSMSSEVSCGEITMTFSNPTKFKFVFDYRVNDEEPSGPGYGTGPVYREVDVPSGGSEIISLLFTEDTGDHEVAYRLNVGAEQDWYLPWETETIKSDCMANESPSPSPSPSATSSPAPSQSPTLNPSPSPSMTTSVPDPITDPTPSVEPTPTVTTEPSGDPTTPYPTPTRTVGASLPVTGASMDKPFVFGVSLIGLGAALLFGVLMWRHREHNQA